jgi:hypothetical protein
VSQVGSLCDKVDYDIHNVVAYINADYTVNEKLRFYGDLTYTYSKADADNPHFGNPFDVIDTDGHAGPSYNPKYDPWFVITYTGDMDDMSDWYDLKMERVDASVGFDWTVWKNLSVTTNFTYRWYNDEEEYLYEDTDGEAYILNTGLTWKF